MGEALCSPHMIREKILDRIILEEINRVLYYTRTRTEEFAGQIRRISGEKTKRELIRKLAETAKSQKRITELKPLFKRLYEDNVLGRISDEQFQNLSSDYTEEKNGLEARILELETDIRTLRENTADIRKFLETARQYTAIRELTPEILRTFISRIVIHEREIRNSRRSPQQVDIYFRFIGNVLFEIPEEA